MQEITECSLLDGGQHASFYALAKAGNFGSSLQNCVCRSVLKESFDLLLPHEMFAALSQYKAFATFFDSENLKKFWSETLQRDADRLRKHPCTLDKG